jgi:hypothetical protein
MDEFIIIRISENYPPRLDNMNFFYDARDAAVFMWGKQAGKYIIYKNNRLAYYARLYPDIDFLEEYLSGDVELSDLD